MRALIRAATAPNLEDDQVLDDLIRTDGWQTVMTFARELLKKLGDIHVLQAAATYVGSWIGDAVVRLAYPYNKNP